jgi:hypothetical protein
VNLTEMKDSKEVDILLYYDQIKGSVTYSSMRKLPPPKTRMVMPYEFVSEEEEDDLGKHLYISYYLL